MGSGGSKKNNALLATLADHEQAINCMALSEDGSLLVTGSDDKTARMWYIGKDAECVGIFRGHNCYISCVAIHDTYLVTGSNDKTIRKWDMTTCDCIFVYTGHTEKINRLLCTDDFIFSSSKDKTVRAWLFEASDDDQCNIGDACIKTFEEKGHTKSVGPIIYIPGCSDPSAPDKGSLIHPGDVLVTGSLDGTARSWSFEKGSCLKVFKGHTNAVTCMVTDPFGQILYTGSYDTTIRSWKIKTGEALKVMEGHTNGILCLTVVNRLLYSGSKDHTASCWVREMGDSTRTYKGHDESIVCLKFSDGFLFTGSSDSTAAAFDSKSGERLRQYKGHTLAISCLAVVNDRLITGSYDSTLRVWDITELSDKCKNSDSSSDSSSSDSDSNDSDDEEKNRNGRRFQERNEEPDDHSEDPVLIKPPEDKKTDFDLDCIEEQLK